MKRSVVVFVVGMGVVVGLWVSRCSGPLASVVGAPMVTPPAQAGQPYRVEASIVNSGPGHGQVEVTFRLRDVVTGAEYEDVEQTELEAGEQTHVVAAMFAPDGMYQPEVEVRYPPG